jgi:UrcA family protein
MHLHSTGRGVLGMATRVEIAMNRSVFMLCGLAAAVSLAFPAVASGRVAVSGAAPLSGDGYMVKQATVVYDDLNVSSAPDAAQLLARIDRAATAVCRGKGGASSADLAAKIEKCRVKAVSQAVKSVDAPQLTQAAAAATH